MSDGTRHEEVDFLEKWDRFCNHPPKHSDTDSAAIPSEIMKFCFALEMNGVASQAYKDSLCSNMKIDSAGG